MGRGVELGMQSGLEVVGVAWWEHDMGAFFLPQCLNMVAGPGTVGHHLRGEAG